MTDECISPLRQRMIEDMSLRHFGEKTQKDYIRAVKNLTIFLQRSPDTASNEELRLFQLHLAENRVGAPTMNSTVSALRFFFTVTLDRADAVRHLAFVHEPRKLPDVFGLTRRTVESLEAQADAQVFALEAAYLTLTSNIVVAAVQEASLRGQIAATQQIIKLASEFLVILRRQRELGQIPDADVAAQEAALAQVEQTLPPLQRQLEQQRHLLTALTGRLPSEEGPETFELAALHLPANLPLSLPSRLVEQRPDIRAAEANL